MLNKIYEWELESLAEHSQITEQMVSQSDKPLICTLRDFTRMEKYPMNVGTVGKAVKPLLSSTKLGWVIIIMDNPMISFLSKGASGMYSIGYHTVKGTNEAYDYLRKRDANLIHFL